MPIIPYLLESNPWASARTRISIWRTSWQWVMVRVPIVQALFHFLVQLQLNQPIHFHCEMLLKFTSSHRNTTHRAAKRIGLFLAWTKAASFLTQVLHYHAQDQFKDSHLHSANNPRQHFHSERVNKTLYIMSSHPQRYQRKYWENTATMRGQ